MMMEEEVGGDDEFIDRGGMWRRRRVADSLRGEDVAKENEGGEGLVEIGILWGQKKERALRKILILANL